MNVSDIINKFKIQNAKTRLRIAVIGDTLVDEYRYGQVNRISPEFPVPILTSESDAKESCPGGAANVCHQMTHMNAEVFLVGFVDNVTRKLYGQQTFNIDYCVDLPSGFVPIKVRFYEGDFPLLRWDIESPNYGEKDLSELRRKILINFESLIKEGLSAVIISDYNKGIFDEATARSLMQLCTYYRIPTIVDPKKPPVSKWFGATVIKPNAAEAKTLTGESTISSQLSKLCENAHTSMITQGGDGVICQIGKEIFEYMSPVPRSKEVNSVIGAGDCFIAMLTLGMSHGMTTQEAVALAFEAGAVYVKARHNKPIHLNEILARVDVEGSRIVKAEELNFNKNERIVFTNGCFDVIHAGHLDTLKFAKCQGDRLIVGVNSDASVKRLKGDKRPIYGQDERARFLASMYFVDHVVIFDEDTPAELINKIQPHIVVKGGDYSITDVVAGNAKVVLSPLRKGYSSTNTINKLSDD
jgi:D-beta-D-heptose 7-phosphate kinase/D-beta-D-heptose 1-phosphate adenosyltransferase